MLVFIDGENFRQRLSELLEQEGAIRKNTYFEYDLRRLLEDVLGTKDLQIRYYASEIKTPTGYIPSKEIQKQIDRIRTNMRRWVANLAKQNIEYIKAGNLKVKEGKECFNCHTKQERLQEKGVDVRLALDIFEASLDPKTKEIAVVSSDTDICPAYHKVKAHKTRVKYVCFARSLNRAVSAATDETVTITIAKAAEYCGKML